MAVSEIENFARKFILLCQDGVTAKLQAKSFAGKVTVSLSAEFGTEKKSPPQKTRHHGPSRERRRLRRAKARAEHAAAQADVLPENGDTAAEADVFHPSHAEEAVQTAVVPPLEDVAVQTADDDAAVETAYPAVQAALLPNYADVQHYPLPSRDAPAGQAEWQGFLNRQVLQDALCPDAEYCGLGRGEQERLDERQQDLENIRKMIEKSCKF